MSQQQHQIFSTYSEDTLRVQSIRASLISPEEIRRRSVAKIDRCETYNGSEPTFGGLFDIRMGVLDNGRICPTDENDSIRCPGYFGHVELAKPVFYVQFMRWIIDSLRLICYRCSAVLIDRKRFTEKDAARLFSFTKRHKMRAELIKVVDAHRLTKCSLCDAVQPDKFMRVELIIQAVFKANPKTGAIAHTFNLSAEYVYHLFRRISEDDTQLLGFSPKNRPEWMICTVLPVLPPVVRPSVTTDGSQRSEDDLTHKMVDIIKSNRDLGKKIAANADKDVIDTHHAILQFHVGTLIDNSITQIDLATQPNGRPLKSLSERMKGKEGRIRNNLMGKRVDFSARSVITPEPSYRINDLGVPIEICMNMTYREVVTIANYERLQRYVRNGPNKYPGAKSLFTVKDKSLNYLKYTNLDARANALEVGDIVVRHLIMGDPVLFNRY